MCGTDTVYFKDRAFANDKSLQELDKARWMPVRAVAYKFACDADFPHDDSTEGQAAWDAKGKKMQQDLEDGEEKLKQLYIEAGDPKQLISRSWEDADGNIHSYSLLNGTLCESVSYGASRQSNCHKVK
ncbi:hypothetical protein CJ666_22100 [Salmonella enterica]|nr:hypothetical protein [Salmonella enterica]